MIMRGQIRNRDRKRQIVDFRGLVYGTITPTDLDGLIDYHNESFAFFELKHRDAEMDRGQKLALIRVVDAIACAGKRSALFVASHTTDQPMNDIAADRCWVRRIYELGTWREPDQMTTLREALDVFLGFGPSVRTEEGQAAQKFDPEYLKDLYAYLARARKPVSVAADREPGEEG